MSGGMKKLLEAATEAAKGPEAAKLVEAVKGPEAAKLVEAVKGPEAEKLVEAVKGEAEKVAAEEKAAPPAAAPAAPPAAPPAAAAAAPAPKQNKVEKELLGSFNASLFKMPPFMVKLKNSGVNINDPNVEGLKDV